MLRGIAGFVEEQPDIYPMDQGSIVIDLRRPGIGSSILMVVERDGSGVLFYRASGQKRRVRVDNAVDLLEERRLLAVRPPPPARSFLPTGGQWGLDTGKSVIE